MLTRKPLTTEQKRQRQRDNEKRASEREARRRADRKRHQLKMAVLARKNAWLASDEGKARVRAETCQVFPVEEFFPDATDLGCTSGYPSRRYGWESLSADAKFTASFDYISNRGSWRLDLRGETIGGEFGDLNEFAIVCPEGTGYLAAEQRQAILGLLVGPKAPQSVCFQRKYNWYELSDRLWRNHIAESEPGEQKDS